MTAKQIVTGYFADIDLLGKEVTDGEILAAWCGVDSDVMVDVQVAIRKTLDLPVLDQKQMEFANQMVLLGAWLSRRGR